MLKRLFDLSILVIFIVIFITPCLIIALAIKLESRGPVLFWSQRFGKSNKLFMMPKFRSMKIDSPNVASHLLINPHEYLTKVGRFLRLTSLDELPQLCSILIGDMSFVGPRPALFSQQDLIDARTTLGIDKLKPGLTGWAQINGRDEITLKRKVELEEEYLEKQSLLFDIKILFLTVIKVITRNGVNH
jgi:O-antigen biosynthesis protein WbqP